MSATKTTPSTYGIHFVKVITIAHQVMVHAQAWLTLSYPAKIETAPSYLALRTMILTGAISMAVPMTATAILRLNFTQQNMTRLPKFDWKPFIWLCLSLMFLESCKQVWLFGAIGFFEWDALHTIAVTFIIILLVGRHSIFWLWPIALGMIALGPLLDRWVGPYEKIVMEAHPATQPWDAALLGQAFSALVMLIWAAAFLKIFSSRLNDRKKVAGSAILCFIAAVAIGLCLQIQNSWGDEIVLRLLPLGALIGSFSGHHIWGIFPWAGVIMLGFLIYDLLIRRPTSRTLCYMTATSVFCFALFYWEFADQTIQRCTPQGKQSGFNGVCFNRTHGQILLVVACFLLLVVAGRWIELWGRETRSLRAVSRAVLWIYLFATVSMQALAQWWVLHIPASQLIWSFVAFSLLCSYVLAMILDHVPLSLSITLKKVSANA